MNPHTRDIINDTLILVACSCVLGGLSWIVSKSFSGDNNPSLDLITVMKKAESKEINASDEAKAEELREKGMKDFLQTLRDGEELARKEGMVFVNMKDAQGRTPIMWVCYANYNNIETTMELEPKRAPYLAELLKCAELNIDQEDNDGWTALHWAAWSGFDKLSDMLIQKKADINKQEGNGFTPLMLAAMRGNDQVVRLLLELGADAQTQNKFHKTALQLAEEGALAYQNSFDINKTQVGKISAQIFKEACREALSTALPELKEVQAVTALVDDIVGRKKYITPSSVRKQFRAECLQKQIITAEEFEKLWESLITFASPKQEVIDVRAKAFEHTVELLNGISS